MYIIIIYFLFVASLVIGFGWQKERPKNRNDWSEIRKKEEDW